ncbi:protein of unknown function [Clostridium beijerinckii]|nr:protein of unknown function [Clostridium beijerinckii]
MGAFFVQKYMNLKKYETQFGRSYVIEY